MICALATPAGVSALAVIRLSGAGAEGVIRKISPALSEKLEGHHAYHTFLRDPSDASILDEVIVTYFAKGRSYTGEASFEISCHGSQAVTENILRALVAAGSRMAERGEFTYRAFLNGRIDLIQAESILDLIESQSLQAAKLSMRGLRGELSSQLQAIENDITWILAQLEANIDFSSEDITFTPHEEIISRAKRVKAELQRLRASYESGREIKEGLTVVLVGKPNVGKSSLFNRLAGEERAIVSTQPGTTRDTIDFAKNICGHRVRFIDCAGVRSTNDEVEQLGIERSKKAIETADVILKIIEASDQQTQFELEDQDGDCHIITVGNKSDLIRQNLEIEVDVLVSAHTGFGIDQLIAMILKRARRTIVDAEAPIQNARQYEGISSALSYVNTAEQALLNNESPEFVASDLYAGLQELLKLRGTQLTDEVTDRVFRDFCIGK